MECPVCFDIFQTPLMLPGCGHTICRGCAELLITDKNFLRCPECRLSYHLKKGINSLPKNVALLRTIEEHQRNATGPGIMCDTHPDDTAHLYCKTCEKLICLKCYFTNTLRKGESTHSGHQVDTSEDIFSKEKRLLSEMYKRMEEAKKIEIEKLKSLETSEQYLKNILEVKLKEIDKNKLDLISSIKHMAGKMKFAVREIVSKEISEVEGYLESMRSRMTEVENNLKSSKEVLTKYSIDIPSINPIKESRKRLETLLTCCTNHQSKLPNLKHIEKLNTDLLSCFMDPNKAFAQQAEPPKPPHLKKENVIISDTSMLVKVKYCENILVKRIEVFYKSINDKIWNKTEETNPTKGSCTLIVKGLQPTTVYMLYALANNDFGPSDPSVNLYIQTFSEKNDIKGNA